MGNACCQDRPGTSRPDPCEGPSKAQLTLPEEIRRALHVGEGDEVEFAVHDDGTITDSRLRVDPH